MLGCIDVAKDKASSFLSYLLCLESFIVNLDGGTDPEFESYFKLLD